MNAPQAASHQSRSWHLIHYFDPARDGFVTRMLRLALWVLAAAMLAAAVAILAVSRTQTGRYGIAYALSATQSHEQALPVAEGLVRDFPTGRWEYYRLVAFNLRHLGRIEESLAVYDRAIAAIPDSWWAHSHRCFYNAMLADPARVMDSCDRSIELDPADPSVAFERRAIARALTGDRAGAIADLEIAVESYRTLEPGAWQIDVRTRWLDALRAGEDPFTPEELALEMEHY